MDKSINPFSYLLFSSVAPLNSRVPTGQGKLKKKSGNFSGQGKVMGIYIFWKSQGK